MRFGWLALILTGCATVPATPEQMPEGIVCVSTLTTTVVTVGKVSSPMTISPSRHSSRTIQARRRMRRRLSGEKESGMSFGLLRQKLTVKQ